MTNDFYWRKQPRDTPTYLFTFYVTLGHYKCMDKRRMAVILDNHIIPGVCNEKAEIATEVLKEIQAM